MSSEKQIRPYGAWVSPITTDLIVAGAVGLGEIQVDGDDVWWSELRPSEGGRVQLVRRTPDGATTDMLPAGFNARTRVHEYGGGAWWLHRGTVFFANWDDQRLYRLDADDVPVAITRDPIAPHALRYADGRVTPDGRWVICVRESHEAGGEAVNELVAIPTAGGSDAVGLVDGPDFVSFPRVSNGGDLLCWTQWNHPNMPWDGTELWVGSIDTSTDGDIALTRPARVAGDVSESVFQPSWSPDDVLTFVSDRSGWWNLHQCRRPGRPERGDTGANICQVDADQGSPQWVFAMSRYGHLPTGGHVVIANVAGREELWRLDDAAAGPVPIETGYDALSCLKIDGDGRVVLVAASFVAEPAIVRFPPSAADPPGGGGPVFRPQVLKGPRDLGLERADLSIPEPVTFGTSDGQTAHGLFYPPTNRSQCGPDGTRPPLLVSIHGGPTAAARSQLQLGVQFWTSRGFGVVDVNYRGSTGYGRSYRRLLDAAWGLADVDDCAAAARHLAERDQVDGARLAIHGGSAGGYTTLCALAFTDAFTAGTSSYGVADLEALAQETHKFESRYLDSLVGPYPERRDIYLERSPINHVDRLDRPLLILQGLEDEIVPPNQAEMMAEALRARGIPFAYLAFEGEQHGFRQAATIVRALQAELAFYGAVFGFDPADELPALDIENLAFLSS